MAIRERAHKQPEAKHFEQAIEYVLSTYPQAVFGRGDDPIPDDSPRETKDMITAKSFFMARIACEEILRMARELADLPDDPREP